MILASLPFVRYIQLVAGTAKPLYRDSQVRAYLATIALIVLAGALPHVTQGRRRRNKPARGALQRDLDHLGHGLFQHRLPALGRRGRWSPSSSSG
jgi:hypothetical protein